MLLGSSFVKVDETGRIRIPKDFSQFITANYGRKMYVTSEKGNNVLIYPLEIWYEKLKKIKNASQNFPLAPLTRKYLNTTGYYGKIASIDSKERILIYPFLREKASIKGELLLIGNIDHLVLWNKDEFEKINIEEPLTDEELAILSKGEG